MGGKGREREREFPAAAPRWHGACPSCLSIPRASPVEVACREFYLQNLVFCAKGAGRAKGSEEAELTIPLLRSSQARMG